ncbi:MAG: hypothetical protein ISS45_08105 [Candidatus Omnitrophica bacterium]|nr:hypothetical protein [Candidatus Omnitrophota bacterium]
MSRILITTSGEWFDELKAVAYYGETELEKWIYQHTESLFPHHYVIPFKKEVASRITGETSKPDFVLIRRDFLDWTVVEVELKRHTLAHVLSQTRVFLDGEYNLPEITKYVRDKFLELYKKRVSLSRLMDLFDSSSPSILVIADECAEDWKRDLGKLGVKLGIFEIYKNVNGRHVYRIFGEYPKVYDEEAYCRPHKSIPNLVEVIGNFTFTQVGKGGLVDVFYDEYLTQWCFFKEQKRQYLRFVGISNPLPLSPSDTYCLFRDKFNRYYFKRS